ncbi:MAG TPA: hypothetical protein VGM75_33200 [Pseudonocardiaceae bacterium]
MAGSIAVAALLLAACGGPSNFSAAPQSGGSSGATEGPTTLVRFVVITPPGFGPIDLVDPHDTKHKYATGLAAGTVTDYLKVPQQLEATDATGKVLEGFLAGMDGRSQRNTMVIGPNNNNGGAQFFKESNGQVGYDAGSIGGKLPTDKPVIISIGGGLLQGGPANMTLQLGQGPGKCVAGAVPDAQTGTINQSESAGGSVPVYYAPASGSSQLSLYGNAACQLSEASSVDFTMRSGQFAYVVPWLADSTHIRFLVVPVTADKPGTDGVVDAPVGPAWTPDPCAVSMCVDGSAAPSTDDTSTSNPGN